MTSFTTWTRIEPRPRADDMRPSVEARVHDPAWLLARQWQVGEYVGEDAASPVYVALDLASAPIVAYQAGTAPAVAWNGTPIDAVAGAQSRGTVTLASAAEAGAELLALLRDYGCSRESIRDFLRAHPLAEPTGGAADGDGLEFLLLLAGRLPNPFAVEAELRAAAATGAVAPALVIRASDHAAFVRAARAWVGWLDALEQTAVAERDAWQVERLEHRFTLGVRLPDGRTAALAAREWDGDRLDWYDVELDAMAQGPAPPGSPPETSLPPPRALPTELQGVAAPLRYSGMPSSRWWEFEDANVNFAQISAGKVDLARMLVVEFASVYGNDWYLWPLILPVGAVHQIRSITVTNTFGETVNLGPIPSYSKASTPPDWQIFRTCGTTMDPASGFDGLVLFPALAGAVSGEPLEQVRCVRDELANLAWAIEQIVEGEDGRQLDRHSTAEPSIDDPRAATPPGTVDDTSMLHYRFGTEVPVYWFPLVPLEDGSSRFKRLITRRVDAAGVVHDFPPRGRILAPEPLVVWQEEVPREGVELTSRYSLARASGGTLHVWRSRRKRTGFGEASSGQRYDDAVP